MIKHTRQHYWDIWKDYRLPTEGKVCQVVGTLVEAYYPKSILGGVVRLEVEGRQDIYGEVVGFREDRTLLLPFGNLNGLVPGARVIESSRCDHVLTGNFLLGQILDAFGSPLETEWDPIKIQEGKSVPLDKKPPSPMKRQRINSIFPLGVKSIDGLLTFCEGQRMGIMAGSGVGKSVLLGMIARNSRADVNVIGLLGERGREVRDFLERDLRKEGLEKSVVIVVTSDESPLMRLRGMKVVTAIAESFAENGKKVLLMVDSLSRVAQSQREVGLAVGEPPTSKGYPPSVFSLLPKILERCGPQPQGQGSISGLYTVLVDGDDFHDPIPDTIRGILDGHICLSRDLATQGHFPAIDVPASISRLMQDIVSPEHNQKAQNIRSMLACYDQNKDYVNLGAYQAGSHPELDQALKLRPDLVSFLKQAPNETMALQETLALMEKISLKMGETP